jgi:hypothetical protein
VLARPEEFITGPLPLRRDSAARLGVGFTVRDGDYLRHGGRETRILPPNSRRWSAERIRRPAG